VTIPKTYSAKAVANYFLEKGKREGVGLTPMQLIKLVYFAYGWSLAIFDRPLIDERLQAWRFGPAIPSLYHEFMRKLDEILNQHLSLCVNGDGRKPK
jgi:uncharacterized phage-associated protein